MASKLDLSRIRFSIWDILVLTSFVALILSLTLDTVKFIAGCTMYMSLLMMLLSIIAVFARKNLNQRKARAEKFLLHGLVRAMVYTTFTMAVSLLSLIVRSYFEA